MPSQYTVARTNQLALLRGCDAAFASAAAAAARCLFDAARPEDRCDDHQATPMHRGLSAPRHERESNKFTTRIA
jgi:hypothetical protein